MLRTIVGVTPPEWQDLAKEETDAHIPYAVLLYEHYLGRPFASHRDGVSELVGDVMESAIEGSWPASTAGGSVSAAKTWGR